VQAATHVNDKKEGVLEGVSDTIINAFTKVKQKDDRFTAIRSNAEKLEANLNDIEKVGAKVTKRQSDLVMDFEDLNSSLTELGNVETDLRVQLDSFGRTLLNNGAIMKEFVRHGIIALRKDLTPWRRQNEKSAATWRIYTNFLYTPRRCCMFSRRGTTNKLKSNSWLNF